MRITIKTVIVTGLILGVINFLNCYIDIDLMFSAFSSLFLICIALYCLIIVVVLWREYKFAAFIPFLISLLLFPVVYLFGFAGLRLGMHNLPSYPQKYFSEQRKTELTAIAEKLLQTDDEKIKDEAWKHRLVVRRIEKQSGIVEFGYYRSRRVSIYIFAKNGLPEDYSTSPVITEDDIRSWAELADMIKVKDDVAKFRDQIVFDPLITYPVIMKYIDKPFADKLASMETCDEYLMRKYGNTVLDGHGEKYQEYLDFIESKFTPEEKAVVVKLLNDQSRISSKLVEDSNITSNRYGLTLWFRNATILSGFDVCLHLHKLIRDGVILVDNGHLHLKSSLNDKEIREVEWLQVELMDHIYGNLVHKNEYWSGSKTKLADNWYFYKIY
ncbi:MAG: hypothetical protein LLF92_11740 [Planctomycetaceae bacterium]|nr:hypothetical protein [Planctomycetaceae bacterium]